jgi:hypothetical protein
MGIQNSRCFEVSLVSESSIKKTEGPFRNYMKRSLNVCYGVSGEGSLFAAGFEPTIAFGHGFDGCIQDFQTYEEYESAFQKSLQQIYHRIVDWVDIGTVPLFYYRKDSNNPPIPLTSHKFLKITQQCDDLIVWLSLGFNDNLLLAFLIRLFTLYSLPLEKIKVKRIESQLIEGDQHEILSIAMVSPKELRKATTSVPLQQLEIDLLTQGWDAITSSTPEKMEAYLDILPTTRFQEGIKDFRKRLPFLKTGLNRCQTDLLGVYPLDKADVKASWLVGSVMGKNHNDKHLDLVGDAYIFWNLMQMTNLYAKEPAFIIEQPYTREQSVALTAFGRAILEGKANWRDENSIDYYVGGLHIC